MRSNILRLMHHRRVMIGAAGVTIAVIGSRRQQHKVVARPRGNEPFQCKPLLHLPFRAPLERSHLPSSASGRSATDWQE